MTFLILFDKSFDRRNILSDETEPQQTHHESTYSAGTQSRAYIPETIKINKYVLYANGC